MNGGRMWTKASDRDRRHDDGYTLVELMVAVSLLAIIFTMVAITFGFLFQQSTTETNATKSGSAAETSLWTVRVPLRYAVTPYVAAINTDTVPTTTSPCWGAASPAFYPAMPALPAYAPYSAVALKAAGGAAYNSLVSPEDNAILVAHDFDMVFCAQPAFHSSASPPNVYRLWVNPATCSNHTATGGGSCALQLDNYGPTKAVTGCAWQLNALNQPTTSNCSGLTPVTTTKVVTGVWCNLSCQEDVVGNLGSNQLTEPAMFSYFSSPPSAPNFTSYSIPSPSDVGSPSTGPNLVGIHDIELSISTLMGNANATATSSSGVSTSTSSVYLGGTVTTSSTLLDSAPIVSSVTDSVTSLPSGRWTGGNTVFITGAGLGNISSVMFGSVPALSYTVLSSTSVQATVPGAAKPGIVDVRVSDPIYGTSAVSTADNYSYQPVVTAISPTSGQAIGGDSVNITGSGFQSGASVYFGSQVASSAIYNSSTSLTAISPTGALGAVDVTVFENGVTSAVTQPADQFTYKNLPTVASVTPDYGSAAGGTSVTITGTNFVGGATVKFGNNAATSVVVVSGTTITARSPSGAGTVNVTVTTVSGTSGIGVGDLFAYSAPTVTGVSPNAGASSGGTQVTVTGTNFVSGATVAFGASAGTAVTVNSATSITVTSPAGAGTVDTRVTTGAGVSATSVSDLYAYGAPTVTGVSPHFGATTGGTTVTITGTNFVAFAAVSFGGAAPIAYTVNSSTSITATSPAGLGTVDVTVTTPDGTSATGPADLFSYSAPAVSSITPHFGTTGTTVNITGANFVPGATVQFGATAATSVTVNSSTSITATASAGVGTVDVRVTTSSQSPVNSPADLFSYSAPTVTSVSPQSGSASGGTGVTVTGTNFVPGATVVFGATSGTSVVVNSATSISVTSPAGAGTIDVRVTTSSQSATSAADLFTYAPPTVTSVSPHAGTGGTTVAITGTNFLSVAGVSFGASAATSVTVNSSTSITATAPAGSGTVDVTVTTGAGTSTTSVNDLFAYAAPTVTALSVHTGAPAGGTSVTVSGTNFVPGSTVAFGGSAGTSVTVVSATSLTVTSPARST
jgi:prepilin-type N-terminal cleavage/methylation domain-containing protein